MDNFFRRLKYYGIGFGIGLIFVVLLFQQKGCSWTPGNRVKSAILERIIFIDSLDEIYIKAHNISPKILREFIENGTVSFLKSKRNGQEKLYHFHGTLGSDKSFNCLVGYREKSVVNLGGQRRIRKPKNKERNAGRRTIKKKDTR